jgi:hypothetical protein
MAVVVAFAVDHGTTALAGKHRACCCAKCGCECRCTKVCRLECIDKETPVTIWGYKCEDFCIPAPGEPKCEHCRTLDDRQAEEPPCSCPKRFVWTDWLPPCHAKLFTRKKLMKQVATVKTPSYKWVVEDLCDGCQASCRPVRYPAGTELPPRPEVEDAVVVAGVEEPMN